MSRLFRPLLNELSWFPTIDDTNRLLGDWFSRPTAVAAGRRGDAGVPPLNVWEEENAYHVEAEVPGLGRDEIELNVVGNQVTIAGRRAAPSAAHGTSHLRERAEGDFSRTLTFPVEIDAERTEASLVDGVLHVTLPKSAADRPRRIEVKTA